MFLKHARALRIRENLDLDVFAEAAKLFLGTHDFRNFTVKVDDGKQVSEGNGQTKEASNPKQAKKKIKTYIRTITSVIVKTDLDLRP